MNIKNLTSKALAISSIVIIGGCVSDKNLEISGGNTLINAVTDPMSTTRTAVDPTEYESGEIGINWIPSDKIGVFGDKGSSNIPFSNTSATTSSSTIFAGNLKTGEKPSFAYFPYSENAGSDLNSLSGNLAAKQIFDLSTGELTSDYKVGKPTENNGNFYFEHIFAFLKFRIDATGSSVKDESLESITLSVEDENTILAGDFIFDCTSGNTIIRNGTNSVVMEWKNNPKLTSSVFSGYMTVTPSDISGKNIGIEIKTDRHIMSFKADAAVGKIERNSYYTLPLDLKIIEETNETFSKTERTDLPQAEVLPGLQSRLACANRVFSLPDTPFMHKIVVNEENAVISVTGLPEGLSWNSRRNLVEGKVMAEGNYTYTVKVDVPDGESYQEGIALTVSKDLEQPTPFMGWLSWNVVESNISETVVKEIADALSSKGLVDAGYKYLVIDDYWHASNRDSNGNPVADNSKFPNGIKACSDYVHTKGLKFGIYSDAGCKTCGGKFGSQNYEEEDARAYAEWGVDLLKYDFCFAGNCSDGSSTGVTAEMAYELYSAMGNELKKQNRKILFYMCEWGAREPWKWGSETGATTWRCTYDTRDGWNGKTKGLSVGIGVKQSIEQLSPLWPYAGVNRFNDADMMCVGIHGTGKSSNDLVDFSQSSVSIFNKKNLGMTDDEYQTQFAMWCMWSSPLTLSFDVRNNITDTDIKMITNKELIAINQDPMGQQAEYIKKVGDLQYYCKDLANGDVAIAVVNMGSSSANYEISINDYNALDPDISSFKIRNVIEQRDNGYLTSAEPIKGSLNTHATVVYRLSKSGTQSF